MTGPAADAKTPPMLLRGRSDFPLYLRPDARTDQPPGRAAARPATDAGRAQPRPRDHRLLLDRQGADHRRWASRPRTSWSTRSCRRARRGARRASPSPSRSTSSSGRTATSPGLLARGGDGRRLRHDGRRRAARRPRRSLRRLDDLLRDRPRRRLPHLVPERGHALDPQHPHPRGASSSTGRRCSRPSPSAPRPAT